MRFTSTLLTLLGVANLGLAIPAVVDVTGGKTLKVSGGPLPYPLTPFTFKGKIGGHQVSLTAHPFLLAIPHSHQITRPSAFKRRSPKLTFSLLGSTLGVHRPANCLHGGPLPRL
jgi:hypothetical protein